MIRSHHTKIAALPYFFLYIGRSVGRTCLNFVVPCGIDAGFSFSYRQYGRRVRDGTGVVDRLVEQCNAIKKSFLDENGFECESLSFLMQCYFESRWVLPLGLFDNIPKANIM
jgi:hypothetical protein